MKARINITADGYGIGHNWSLVVDYTESEQLKSKSFFLGQDMKFCHRVLGMEVGYIADQIGSRNIEEPEVNERLANFIIDSLDLTLEQIKGAEAWSLCAQ